MVSRNRGNNILELRKRPSRLEKGVSLCRKEPLLVSKKRPLYLQSAVFTPLSIRRGNGGEAVDGLLVRLVVVVIETSSFPLGGVRVGLTSYSYT